MYETSNEHMSENQIKRLQVFPSTMKLGTPRIIDEFLGLDEKGIKYDQMVILEPFMMYIKGEDPFGQGVFVNLIVEYKYVSKTYGDITFTQVKDGKTQFLADYIFSVLGEEAIHSGSGTYTLDPPYLFRAQASCDIGNYGKIWHGEDLVYQHNFGDATSFVISAVEISKYPSLLLKKYPCHEVSINS